MSPPLLLGHRGARATRAVPENTLESFDLALAHGCNGFEFDLRLTADGRAVVCHDATSDGREIARAGACDLKDLPRLGQVLARYSEQAFLDIEIKVTGLEKILLKALESHLPRRGHVASSFLPEVLLALRALDQEIPLGLICEVPSELAAWKSLPVQYVIPHYTLVNEDLVRILQAEEKKVLVWTVNTRERMLQVNGIGVDGIISDNSRLLVEVCRSQDLSPEP